MSDHRLSIHDIVEAKKKDDRIAELEAENEEREGWDWLMDVVRSHYPQDVDYFAKSGDHGCRIIRTIHAIDDERKRAEQAEAALAERDKMLELLVAMYAATGDNPANDDDPEYHADILADLRARTDEGSET